MPTSRSTGDEASELKKIASRAPEHDLVYATDEDSFLNDDPYVNRWDLGADPCEFGKDRIALASELLKDLDARVVKDGDSWARTRRAFAILLEQWGDGATLASQYIGGQSVSRDHKADKDARDPIVPVAGAKQRECLKFLADHPERQGVPVLAGPAPPAGRRALDALGHQTASTGPGVDISVLERILGIQKIVLGHCLSPATLARLAEPAAPGRPGHDPLRMDEVFRSLTDGIWSDLDKLPEARKDAKAAKVALSHHPPQSPARVPAAAEQHGAGRSNASSYGDSLRLRRLHAAAATARLPADARALARLHLKEIAGRIGMVLETKNASHRRHQPGPPRRVPAPDRQGPRGQPRHQGALSFERRD